MNYGHKEVSMKGFSKPSIQNGIDFIKENGTVYVYNGTYEEQINVSKSVILEGESNTSTIIVGGFNISVDNTTITNFNITGGYEWNSYWDDLSEMSRFGIYTNSSNNTFYYNNIYNITGDDGIGWVENVSSAGIAVGIYLQSSNNSYIFANNLSNITGGMGGAGAGCGGESCFSGSGTGICLNSSSSNTIHQNMIYNINGGNGDENWPPYGDISGANGAGINLYCSSSNTLSHNIIRDINGGNGGYYFSHCAYGFGGHGIGIYLQSSPSNSFIQNNIFQINGGDGADPEYNDGTTGGIGAGLYLRSSPLNSFDQNSICNVTGGKGGGGAMGPGGSGGTGTGIYLQYSNRVNINYTLCSNISGGRAGSWGIAEHGGGGLGSGLYLEYSNMCNITFNKFSNIKAGAVNEGFLDYDGVIGANSVGIHLQSSLSNTIHHNIISNISGGAGGMGFEFPVGGIGGIGAGINLQSSSSNSVSQNTIQRIIGGNGGDGYVDDNVGGGNGGLGAGIIIDSSILNNISSNVISNLTGGIGGSGFFNGTNGSGAGLYIKGSSNNSIDSCIFNYSDYGIYANLSSDNLFYNNYLCNNTINAFDDGVNIWNITKTQGTNIIGGPYLGGNYWSDYLGIDMDGDLIGDTFLPHNSSQYILNGGDWLPLLLIDIIPPQIQDNTPITGYTGDSFTFNSTITDRNIVREAWVEYWYGSGSHANFSMSNVAGDIWEKSIIVDDTLEILHYVISANDTSNNWNHTEIKNVTIYDNDIPEITNVQAIPPSQIRGEYLNISAMVTDNIEGFEKPFIETSLCP